MLEQVESGPVVWTGEDGEPIPREDAKLVNAITTRHALDAAEDRARFGKTR